VAATAEATVVEVPTAAAAAAIVAVAHRNNRRWLERKPLSRELWQRHLMYDPTMKYILHRKKWRLQLQATAAVLRRQQQLQQQST
jgi:hypothetical protein